MGTLRKRTLQRSKERVAKMTSDIYQNELVEKQTNIARDIKTGKRFLGSTGEFLGFLKKNDTYGKTVEATALLKAAYKMLQQTERDLAKKEKRIKDLESILTIDELTGITNRRGFYANFKGELDRTNRAQNTGGLLIMIDLDYFKTINDTFGHLAGDEALRTVALFLKSTVRPMDLVARMGGDEFIILMPNTSIAKAMKRAKKIGNDLNALTFDWKGSTVHIHGSLGLKEYSQGDTIESIIEQADKGMYKNKKERQTKH